ncbi:MAG: DUF4440 domain-containing protein [Planctomycetota bacterium]
MREERGSDFAVVAVVTMFLLLAVGGGAFYLQTRRNASLRAAEVARMRAAEMQLIAQRATEQAARITSSDAQAVGQRLAEISMATDDDDAQATKIKTVLRKQQQAWNAGDIDGFMDGYWKSDELTFSSGGEITRSWQSTIDRYKKKYATREAMGTLEFSELEVKSLGTDAAYVLGRWNLKDIAGGNFTLIMRKLDADWVVVHDHTSVLEPKEE